MMRPLLLAAALVVVVGCDSSSCRCHSGYYVTSYHDAYTEHGENCSTVNSQRVCVPFDRYHPARCDTNLECIINCADWDKGQAEAHPKHGVHLGPQVVDWRCTANGEVR